ncbi:MAG: Pyruvate synthase subunit PorD [Candidatus Syntrophoarchaeum sp. GoM_oil]|nr:MAG: Pyruvate synthase subunit PorD [Candidatus Syntrophoarchaeum sp. GoM_oil]
MKVKMAISYPKIGASGRTGDWRVFMPVVDREVCINCYNCYIFCPEGTISPELEVDYEYCKGCGICANECPPKAIKMVKEERSG